MMNKIALYIRLSVDKEKDSESESVKNQRDLLNKYINDNFQDKEVIEYVDEGFSGTSFDRPAFNALIKAVENNEVGIVLVKDLSRLGRNYIDSLHYIEQVFPLYNVKLIAVNDNIDTKNNTGSASIETSFKALINSYYSKDLSKKIKSSYRNKTLKGEWLFDPCYGYKKSETQKNKLVIDSESSQVVVEIFKMALEGVKITDIARVLNDKGILTPMKYSIENKRSTKKAWGNKSDEVYWTYNNVYRILKDEKYTGKLILNKKELLFVGSKYSRKRDKSEWLVVDDAIEQIISKEDFDEVQSNIGKITFKVGEKSNDIFKNKIVCGKCNRNLWKYNYKYKGESTIKYNCRFYKTTSNELCFDGYLYRNDLMNVIIEDIKLQVKVYSDLINDAENRKEQHNIEIANLNQVERTLESEIRKFNVRKKEIIENLLDDKISDDEFSNQTKDVESKINNLTNKLKEIVFEKKQMELVHDTKKYEKFLDMLDSELEVEKTIELMAEFIDKILVYDKDKIEIVYNFENIFL